MSVIVKLRFHDEIRRLSLTRVGLTLPILLSEISKALLLSKFSVKYLDEENDEISLSSEIELKEALRQIDERKQQVLKLVVNEESFIAEPVIPKASPPPQPSVSIPAVSPLPNENTHPTHHKIICNSCNIEIIGTRWKCSVCPNLNLCELCEPWDKHNVNHPFLRMKVPVSQCFETAFSTFTNAQQIGLKINQFFASPQVAEVSSTVKKMSEETLEAFKNVTEQFISQTREINKEIGTVIKNEANNLFELCSNLNDEFTKSYCSPIVPQTKPKPPQLVKAVNFQIPPVNVQPAPVNKIQTKVNVQPNVKIPKVENPLPSPPPQPVYEYAQQLKQLQDMGFTNEARNRALLAQYKGDLYLCLNTLVN